MIETKGYASSTYQDALVAHPKIPDTQNVSPILNE